MSSHALELRDGGLQGAPASSADRAYGWEILPAVSRTFALTIPELPDGLWEVVTNAYLLCRIADSIEDDPGLGQDQRRQFHDEFASLVDGEGDPRAFAERLTPLFSHHTLEAERDLARNTERIVRVTRSFERGQRDVLARGVRTMCSGMPRFQSGRRGRGLEDLDEYHDYCYYVAGVVGEMLTDLFCEYSPRIAERRAELARRAISFGQGLQMTNILKDIWDDHERGYCWLPREHFRRHGFDLDQLSPDQQSAAFESGLGELLGIAHGHLRTALEYTLAIPREERGIRRFCFWALGMAALTLRKIDHQRDFRRSKDVKIKRRTVKATVWFSNLALGSDHGLRALFGLCSVGLTPAQTYEWELGD